MMRTPFQTFIDLVAFDQSIITLQKECEDISQQLMRNSDAKKQLYDYQIALKNTVLQARKVVDSVELEMKMLDEQEAKKKKLLDQISNFKEYNSIKTELEALHEEQQQKEQEVLAAWNKLEAVQAEFDAYMKDFDAKVKSSDDLTHQYTEQHARCMQEVSEKTQGRASKEQGIPSEWLEKYMIMRERISDPVVPLEEEICSACFHSATKADVMAIKRGGLIQCKGCYRLLYAPSKVSE